MILCVDADFSSSNRTVAVPVREGTGIQTIQLPEFFSVIDDSVNEDDQIFTIVVEMGPDVPDGYGCFLSRPGGTECLGKRGATRVVIRDNDRKLHFPLA